jgi:hypothetical protein
MQKLKNWLINHDNSKIFMISYIGLSVILSITISLFWLLFVVLIHFSFELYAQSRNKSKFYQVFLESLWETKLDFALVIFALWLAVYIDFIFGVAGLGALARGGTMAASRSSAAIISGEKVVEVSTRFAALQRSIRGILLSLDDFANTLKAFFQSRNAKVTKKSNSVPNNSIISVNKRISWNSEWKSIDYIAISLFTFSLIMILLSPMIINTTVSDIYELIADEFHPFPK